MGGSATDFFCDDVPSHPHLHIGHLLLGDRPRVARAELGVIEGSLRSVGGTISLVFAIGGERVCSRGMRHRIIGYLYAYAGKFRLRERSNI